MIFIDKLEERDKILTPEFDRLIDIALKNQSHYGDLLLFHINGSYENKIHILNSHSDKKYNPHVIGPNSEGHSERTHYSFIHKYRSNNICETTYPEYLKLHEWTQERSKDIDKIVEFEGTTIQIEMLVYLKFWEADMVIKKLYQFVRILLGESYDWYFKIQESSRDNTASGTRQNLIRCEIRDRIKDISPILYELIRDTYKTQVRNSIAHSNYSFQGRSVHLNNYIEKDRAAQLHYISFDEWVDIFHNTLALHNQYLRLNNVINDHYGDLAKQKGNEMEIQVTESSKKQYPLIVEYRPEWKDWCYKIDN